MKPNRFDVRRYDALRRTEDTVMANIWTAIGWFALVVVIAMIWSSLYLGGSQ